MVLHRSIADGRPKPRYAIPFRVLSGRAGPGDRALVGRVLPVFDGQGASGDFVVRQRHVTRGIHGGRRGGHVGADDDARIPNLQTGLGGDATLRLYSGGGEHKVAVDGDAVVQPDTGVGDFLHCHPADMAGARLGHQITQAFRGLGAEPRFLRKWFGGNEGHRHAAQRQ